MEPNKQNQNAANQNIPSQQPVGQSAVNQNAPVTPTPAASPSQPAPAFNQPANNQVAQQTQPTQPTQAQSNSAAPLSKPINPRVAPPPAQPSAASVPPQTPPVTQNKQASQTPPSSAARGVTKSATLESYISNAEGKNKKAIFFAVIAAVVIALIALLAIMFLFNGSEEDEVAAAVSQTEEEIPPVPTLEMDSLLRSTDSGQTFDTYFKVVAEEGLGLVDVLKVSFHPDVSDEITIATYNDGLFINENTGDTWERVPFEPRKIYSFVLDQVNPETRAFASGIVSDNGRIFRTDDKGQTWRVVYAEPGNRTFVSALTQDPLSPNIILAGTDKGTFVRSLDGGDTWENIGQSIKSGITDFTHDSTKASFVYLLSRGEVYHSDDAGKNWENWEDIKDQEIKDLTAQARELRSEGDKDGAAWINNRIDDLREKDKAQGLPSGIIEIVADPSRTGVLYAGLSKGLYRSTDFGKYWQPVNIIESAERFPIPSIAINPENSDEISFVAGSSFYRSVNYGATWAVTPLDKTRNASFITYDPFNTETIFIGLSAVK